MPGGTERTEFQFKAPKPPENAVVQKTLLAELVNAIYIAHTALEIAGDNSSDAYKLIAALLKKLEPPVSKKP